MRCSRAAGCWRAARYLLPITALLMVAGCALRPTAPDAGIDWDQREQQLLGATAWRALGRDIGVR